MTLLRPLLASSFAAVLFGFGGAAADAQQPPAPGGVDSIRRPTTSPYINLLRRRSQIDFTLQYHGIVRPELEFRSAISRQGQAIDRLQGQVDEQGALLRSQNSQLGPTGHQVRFLDIGGYFGGLP